jgi:putative intracellular protease/amidase
MHDNSLIVLGSAKYAVGMHIAILTFEGYNELDSLIALGVLNRVPNPDWRVSIASPTPRVRSMNGVVIESHISLDEASDADAVIVGSGRQTCEVVADRELMALLRLDPSRQLLGAQCSGTLVLAKLDSISKPWVQAAGVEVLDQPLFAKGNVATAGGCLSSAYLAGWMIARLEGLEATKAALNYVAPVGEKEEYIERALGNITPYLDRALSAG